MNTNELVQWIRYLYSINRIDKFYKHRLFKHLREEVMKEQHYECQMCKEQGKLTIVKPIGVSKNKKRSGVVHHVNEVKTHPHLALSKYYFDDRGNKQRNLIVLCDNCHEIVHERCAKKQKEVLTEERW